VASLGVDHRDDSPAHLPDDLKALFFVFRIATDPLNLTWVVENGSGFLEANAMLSMIGSVLRRVSVELHRCLLADTTGPQEYVKDICWQRSVTRSVTPAVLAGGG
jgi:hypothetical protein